MRENDHARLFEQVDSIIDEAYPNMEKDLLSLVACPSVGHEAAGEGKPFGADVALAMEQALSIARSLGMDTDNGQGYMAWADMVGGGKGTVGILAHADVVPADPAEWDTDPFCPVVKGERIYGRGTLDDKGPMIAAMYAAYALKKAGAELRADLRFMIGGDEESGCRCLEYYLEHYPLPDKGFSPDAEFPLIIGEKGIFQFRLSTELPAPADKGIRLAEAYCGRAVNILPGTAAALLENARLAMLPAAQGIFAEEENGKIRITAKGKAAHGSMPEEGVNALALLIRYLAALPLDDNTAPYIQKLAELTADDSYGNSTGMAAEDSVSRLTQIPSMLEIKDKKACISFDTRFPVTHKKERYLEAAQRLAQKTGWHMEILHITDPMYVPEEDPIAQCLLEAYRSYTKDMSKPLVIGGGTYVKELDGFLAFGPEFAHTPKLCHQANEYISKKDLLDSAKIYARAIYLLAK